MYVMYGISCMTCKQNIKNTLEHPDPKFQHDSIKRDSILDFPGGQVVDSMLPMHGVVGVTPGGEDSARYVVKNKRERERFVLYSNIFSKSFVYQVSPTNVS